MTVTIKYRAKLTWMDHDFTYHEDELCDVVHEVDVDTLQTSKLDWNPCK